MSDTTNTTQALNQAAAHETGLYDASIHDNQIVAMYDTEAEARNAQQMLEKSGFPASAMQVLGREDSLEELRPEPEEMPKTASQGFWGALASLFVPDQDRNVYNTAIARGHVMLVVTPDRSMDRRHLIHVLEDTHPLDFDAKLEEWRQAGYDSTGEQSSPSRSNVETGGHATNSGLDTGDKAGTDAGSQGAREAEQRYRNATREQPEGARRVRSYISQRPGSDIAGSSAGAPQERSMPSSGTEPEPRPGVETGATTGTRAPDAGSLTGTLPGNTAANPNATPGATTSGANSPGS